MTPDLIRNTGKFLQSIFYFVGRRPDKLRALILTPTRELALQIRDHIQVHIESDSCLIDTVILLKSVLQVRDILVRIRIRGSVPLTSGSGPAILVIDIHDANKKTIFFC